MKKFKRKYTPCWVVLRVDAEGNNAHVLSVFQDLEQADYYATACQFEYDERRINLSTQIQASDFCAFL